mmetsp:Transcript_67844/g.201913  ORF Transcript_67844/g.201913 Transcript_67844/m.201913 type:complete len:215 (-) Transcript_67844:94-738(-)
MEKLGLEVAECVMQPLRPALLVRELESLLPVLQAGGLVQRPQRAQLLSQALLAALQLLDHLRGVAGHLVLRDAHGKKHHEAVHTPLDPVVVLLLQHQSLRMPLFEQLLLRQLLCIAGPEVGPLRLERFDACMQESGVHHDVQVPSLAVCAKSRQPVPAFGERGSHHSLLRAQPPVLGKLLRVLLKEPRCDGLLRWGAWGRLVGHGLEGCCVIRV